MFYIVTSRHVKEFLEEKLVLNHQMQEGEDGTELRDVWSQGKWVDYAMGGSLVFKSLTHGLFYICPNTDDFQYRKCAVHTLKLVCL
jgi:hypothetical protein